LKLMKLIGSSVTMINESFNLGYRSVLLTITILILISCGYRVGYGLKEAVGEKGIYLGFVRNMTGEYGIEQEFIKSLHQKFLSQNIRFSDDRNKSDYELNVIIRSVVNTPISYRQGINVAYTYLYECRIDADFLLINRKTNSRKTFTISDGARYFSSDVPATTEANRRLALNRGINQIVERFIRELTIGIQGI